MRRRETIEEQMVRATQNEKAAAVRTSSSSRGIRVRSRGQIMALSASGLAAFWALTMLTGAGQQMYAMGFFFTEFFAGVIALVALSLTVMMGLLATDRLVLLIRHRVLMQSAHRATGILGVAGLAFHVITKIASGRAGMTDAAVPFVGGRGLYIGLGTIAALLMVGVLWTGIIRARFADVGPKWVWRALHSMAYVSWPFAIFHGLLAGRPPATWVGLSYFACALLVVIALMVRLSVTLQRRSRERQQAAVLNEVMSGAKPTEETRGKSLLGTLTGRRDEADDGREKRVRRDTSWADSTSGTWASPTIRRNDPERFTVPVVPEPGTLGEPVRSGRDRRDEEFEPVVRRASRHEEEELERVVRRETEVLEPVARRRRDAEPGSRRSARRGEEQETTGRRAARVEEEPVARRSRRDEESTGRRSRREEEREPVGRRASRRDEDLMEYEEPVRRRRRDSDDEEEYGRSRRSRTDSRYSAAPQRMEDEPEEPWDSPRRWESTASTSADPISGAPISGSPISAAPRSGGGRHSAEDDLPEAEADYWRPPARYAPEDDVADDDTPTLVDLASRRARRASSAESRRRRRADPDSVDGAYWAGLRGEAK
ncbi:ferric reductase-like transmembrane domain-containing protein [Verrucosispora sp. WMMD573]|uniref:ferric reductase-like transmembrane domain-containing protein n=1 Tax=Verrucosispora sp. WMMD573 TaxID=3015149 RepID=UPI00248D1442|nr:ferric reductase-like transmembrane domain-containing protein [Verrucosispora sp. WMMD573]WBB54408.1 ferric reductase-like transmembrane domain-containing protein [Verrucosispora sp. WMMD573]